MSGKPKKSVNKFIDKKDINNLMSYGEEYLFDYINTFIYIYKPDLSKVETNIYNEVSRPSLIFSEPYKIPAFVNFATAENKTYISDKGAGRYEEYGNIQASMFNKTLSEFGIIVENGDIVKHQVNTDLHLYFTVTNDSKNNFDNQASFAQLDPYWTKIVCTPVGNQSEYIELLG